MPKPDTSQDYLSHYFDIARYWWLVSAMLTVQMSQVSYMGRFYTPLDEAMKASLIHIWRAVRRRADRR